MKDMVELIDALEAQEAVWIGHDWGSPVAWNMALHHPDRVAAVASLCVPFGFVGNPEHMEHSIDRTLYPADEYPVGQWDYQLFYYENFASAQAEMEQDPERVVKLLFRKGRPQWARPTCRHCIHPQKQWVVRTLGRRSRHAVGSGRGH